MYKVIHFFTDLKDNSHPYNVGDTYPREGCDFSTRRYEELSSKYNLQGKPLIQYVDEEKEDFSQYMNPQEEKEVSEEKIYTKTEIKRMSTAELKKLAASLGIEKADTYTGADLKNILIEKLGL